MEPRPARMVLTSCTTVEEALRIAKRLGYARDRIVIEPRHCLESNSLHYVIKLKYDKHLRDSK